jgi:iron complex transport system substrate-binding protein
VRGRLKRPALVGLAIAVAVAVVGAALSLFGSDEARGAAERQRPDAQRIVSLAPAITETLFAIGAGEIVVGVSEYCDYPSEVVRRPRAGSWLSPNYEALVRLEPTLILTSAEIPGPLVPLRRIAPAEQLPWLSIEEMLRSIRRLGVLTGHELEADALWRRLSSELLRQPPPDAPSVLFTLAHQPGRMSEIWYLRDASIHGAVLRAAGGRNAVREPIRGAPRLSLQQILALDPDMVIVLTRDNAPNQALRARYVADFRALELRAARSGRIGVVQGPDVHVSGPRVVDLVERVRQEIERLKVAR